MDFCHPVYSKSESKYYMNSLFMHVQKQNIAKNKKKFEAKESVG